MKDKIWKWMKYKWVAACFVIAVILLAVSGSLAAYTSFNSVKRVVSTDKKRSDTIFSSNYLSLVDLSLSDAQYTTRRISPVEERNAEGTAVVRYNFTIQVCNYIFGNPAIYNLNDIEYTFTVKLIASSGSSLPEGITGIMIGTTQFASDGTCTLTDQILLKGEARENEYVFHVPAGLKDLVKFQIVAEPVTSSQDATNYQKLAGVITLSSLAPTENWNGRFIDNKAVNAEEYDAFNYEISGNGKGAVTLSWPEYLRISSWFVTDVSARSTGNNSCEFQVGGEDSPAAYQLQFFRTPGEKELNWTELASRVTVSFTPDSSSSES